MAMSGKTKWPWQMEYKPSVSNQAKHDTYGQALLLGLGKDPLVK